MVKRTFEMPYRHKSFPARKTSESEASHQITKLSKQLQQRLLRHASNPLQKENPGITTQADPEKRGRVRSPLPASSIIASLSYFRQNGNRNDMKKCITIIKPTLTPEESFTG
jgi:hypothetical protein